MFFQLPCPETSRSAGWALNYPASLSQYSGTVHFHCLPRKNKPQKRAPCHQVLRTPQCSSKRSGFCRLAWLRQGKIFFTRNLDHMPRSRGLSDLERKFCYINKHINEAVFQSKRMRLNSSPQRAAPLPRKLSFSCCGEPTAITTDRSRPQLAGGPCFLCIPLIE